MWASGVEDDVPTVASTQLVDITPNPFNPQTKITYDLARDGRVQLEIYDLQGHLVRTLVDGARGIGRHVETWNGADDAGGKVASGLYMARLTAGGVTQMMKMTLLK
jgi:flagellar hook assembly protein FlgD